MKVKINENELRDMIAKSVNEAFSYDGDDAPMKYNILVSDRDLNEMLYNFPGLINRAAATRGGLNYVYADGKIENDMGGTDYFYVINPRIPDLHSLPTSFLWLVQGKESHYRSVETKRGSAIWARRLCGRQGSPRLDEKTRP